MKPKLIGLYSSVPRSGKTTTAEILKGENYKIISFATPLKEMTLRFLMGFGYSKGDAGRLIKDKDFVIGEVNLRVRDIMQLLGTEWGRNTIHKDVWIRMWQSRQSFFPYVVADDVRFPNEYEAIVRKGGLMLKIEREQACGEKGEKHESEGRLDNFCFDHVICNNGSVSDLKGKVLAFLSDCDQPAQKSTKNKKRAKE